MRRLLLMSAVCVLVSPSLWGADYLRTELFGWAGWGRWWDNEGAPVGGFHVGAGIGRRLLPQFAFEVEADVFRRTRGYPGPVSPYQARGVGLVGNGKLYVFRSPRTQVFLLLGAGAVHSTTETNFGDYHNSRSRTGFVGNAGAEVTCLLKKMCMPGGECVVTLSFDENEGQTTLTSHMLFKSKADRDACLRSGMELGVKECYQKIDELLATR